MKHVLMYTNRPDLDAAIPAERQAEVYQAIFAWFEKHGAAFADMGAELQGPATATTVKASQNGGDPVVVDGPFSEAKESIGGFSIIDVPDLDSALALAREWPSLEFPGVAVEIRPVVEHPDM
ncbi:MAG TPA: YciI family protein [Candidatus Lustribacter sp.]|nr:YciI family protein [Candidatus Lustribacter sp.]